MFKHKRISNILLNFENFIVTTSSLIGLKGKTPLIFKSSNNSILDVLSLEYFVRKTFHIKGNNQGPFTWATHCAIINFNCGVDVNVQITPSNTFKQITKIYPIGG